tara:strand:- start:5183 stop:6427 length:1245 start_codon:yes stop_codon:yes gene_type:complete
MDKLTSLPAWLERGVSDLFPEEKSDLPDQNFYKRLLDSEKNKKPLRVKLGIDPTGTDIHLGHSILLRKLRAFQDAGHTAILIIGDFTARIGDPTGKSKTRVQLSPEEVEANALTYLEQLGLGKRSDKSLLDFTTPGRLEIRRNSDWLKELDLVQIIDLLSTATVGQMLAKEEFAKRYTSGTAITLHEFLYPLLQGYDSVAVNADVELGGTDQKFNIAIGRDMQRHFGQRPQFGLLLPILVGLDGVQKMSKSLANTVGLNEDALSMYSKLEKVPDQLVATYLRLLTDIDVEELNLSHRELQQLMALTITANFHGLKEAKAAQEGAGRLVSGSKNVLIDIPELSLSTLEFPVKAFVLLNKMGLCKSGGDARRQIEGGGVRLNGEKILDPYYEFSNKNLLLGKVIQLGKKTFRRLAD